MRQTNYQPQLRSRRGFSSKACVYRQLIQMTPHEISEKDARAATGDDLAAAYVLGTAAVVELETVGTAVLSKLELLNRKTP